MILLDFGVSRSFFVKFVDDYIRIIKFVFEGDREGIKYWFVESGFFIGYEIKVCISVELFLFKGVNIYGESKFFWFFGDLILSVVSFIL